LKKDVKRKVDLVIAVGGDGTVNRVIQEIAGSNIKLFIIPTGTANDLASELGVKASFKNILQNIKDAEAKKIDLIKVNDRLMSTNGGVGIAADVAREVNLFREKVPFFKEFMKLSKGKIYATVLAKKLISLKIKRYSLYLESTELPFTNQTIISPLILISNQSTLGSCFNIAPETVNNDGKFNVTILKHKSNYEFIKAIVNIFFEKDVSQDSDIISFETDNLIINNLDNTPLDFFGDGESFEANNIYTITTENKALALFDYKDKNTPLKSYSLSEVSLQ
jgi:diacylglycerol kinase (ATP)